APEPVGQPCDSSRFDEVAVPLIMKQQQPSVSRHEKVGKTIVIIIPHRCSVTVVGSLLHAGELSDLVVRAGSVIAEQSPGKSQDLIVRTIPASARKEYVEGPGGAAGEQSHSIAERFDNRVTS